ncbi:MAG: phosphatidylserine decarboxylase [Thermodesulfobacteriota bacterium]
MNTIAHHYIDRRTGEIREERLLADRLINFIYSGLRENAPMVFKALTSARGSSLLGYLNFDSTLRSRIDSPRDLMVHWGVKEEECLDPLRTLDTPEKIFTRRISYWRCRPLPPDREAVVSPADARMIIGSFRETSALFLKDKFFDYAELLGADKGAWLEAFAGGDFAVFRLTPDKYHYNHTPVAGRVADFYEIDGDYHSCNPGAVVHLITPYSKNKRALTIMDTDVPGGTGAGLVAMIEVAALMVGDIQQCYSSDEYNYPRPALPGLFVEKGLPKSLFRPGSSTVVLLFQKDRLAFDQDLIENQSALGVASRFSLGFGRPLVETDVPVRSRIGLARPVIH